MNNSFLSRRYYDKELDIFLKQGQKIQYTIENENNEQLSFMEVLLSRSKHVNISYEFYCKSTHTDRYLNKLSYPLPIKIQFNPGVHQINRWATSLNWIIRNKVNLKNQNDKTKEDENRLTTTLWYIKDWSKRWFLKERLKVIYKLYIYYETKKTKLNSKTKEYLVFSVTIAKIIRRPNQKTKRWKTNREHLQFFNSIKIQITK